MASINNVGFFHFGSERRDDPATSLKQALREFRDSEATENASPKLKAGDCLIVLPEGFNCAGGYRLDAGEPCLEIDDAIRRLSVEFQVAFVAGLMEPISPGKRYNSAFLIDGDIRRLLARKQTDDRLLNYEPADYNCPRFHRGIWIAALICVDGFGFNENNLKEAHRRVLDFLTSRSPKVLCVPAVTYSHVTAEVARRWAPRIPTVIANCDGYQPSVAHVAGREPFCCSGASNKICMTSLSAILEKPKVT
jgi:predicted amidohydrolase